MHGVAGVVVERKRKTKRGRLALVWYFHACQEPGAALGYFKIEQINLPTSSKTRCMADFQLVNAITECYNTSVSFM